MKKVIILFASILFSSLFFQKEIGLNFFIFSLISTGIIFIVLPAKRKEKETLLKASIFIITAFLVFMIHNKLSIFTGVLSFMLFIGSLSNKDSSIYIKFLNGLYATIVAAFVKHYNKINTELEEAKKQKTNYSYWLKIIGIPVLVIVIFVALYRNANPIFDALISKIDFSFLNLQWILFTALGYYFFYNITNPISIEPITKTDIETNNILEKNGLKESSTDALKKENQLGLILMVSLNILLVFLLVTDVVYLTQNTTTLSVAELSEQVHKGINALITSIILAIMLIIYFFRGNLNFYKENKTLKTVTFIWILLNGILVFVTLYKNYQYVHTYGLTYKRIGVFIYLFLAFSGLIFTYIKVRNIKNIMFLFRRNIEMAFAVLFVASFINWDVLITKFNIKYSDKAHIDTYYLLWLNNNYEILKKHSDTSPFTPDLQNKVVMKYKTHLRELENRSWQEWTYDNVK